MSDEILWELPFPSTAMLDFPTLMNLPGRVVVIDCEFDEEGDFKTIVSLIFENVVTYQLKFSYATNSSDVSAYDKVLQIGTSDLLTTTKNEILRHNGDVTGIKHLRIYFDDRYCYDFVCYNFRTKSRHGPLDVFGYSEKAG